MPAPELIDAPEKLWELISNFPQPLLIVDGKFRIKYVNAAAEPFFPDAIEKKIGDALGCAYAGHSQRGCLFAEECSDCAFRLAASQVMKNGQVSGPDSLDLPLLNERHVFRAKFQTTPLFLKADKFLVVIFTLPSSDSGATSSAKLSFTDKLVEFYELSDDMLLITQERKISAINPSVIAFTGYGQNHLLGRDFVDFVIPEDMDKALAAYRKAEKGKIIREELRLLLENGEETLLAFQFIPLYEAEGVVGISLIGRDLTDRLELEEKLAASYQNMESKLFEISLKQGLSKEEPDTKRQASFISEGTQKKLKELSTSLLEKEKAADEYQVRWKEVLEEVKDLEEEIRGLKVQVENLEAQAAGHQKTIAEKDSELFLMEGRLHEKENTLQILQKEFNQAQIEARTKHDAWGDALKELGEKRGAFDSLTAENTRLRQESDEWRRERERLEQARQDDLRRLTALEQELADVRTTRTELQAEFEREVERGKEKTAAAEDFTRSLAAREQELGEQRGQLEEAGKEVAELTSKLELAQAELNITKESHVIWQKEKDQYIAEIEKKAALTDDATGALALQSQKLEEVSAQLLENQKLQEELTVQVETLKSELSALTEELHAKEEALAARDEESSAFDVRIREQEEVLAKTQAEIRRLKDELEGKHYEATGLKILLENMNEELETSSREKREVEKLLVAEAFRRSELERSLLEAREAATAAQSAAEQIKTDSAQAIAEKETLVQELIGQQETVKNLDDRLDEEIAARMQAEKALVEAEQAVTGLTQALAEGETDHSRALSEAANFIQEKKELEAKLLAWEEKSYHRDKELERLNTEIRNLEVANRDLAQQLKGREELEQRSLTDRSAWEKSVTEYQEAIAAKNRELVLAEARVQEAEAALKNQENQQNKLIDLSQQLMAILKTKE